MANFEVLSLDPTTPQIRAPGAGDGYSVPRNMTFAAGTTLAAQAVTATTVSATGNLTFSSTAQRITGDMSNATWSSRVSFQTSTTNANTNIPILPNGTGTNSIFTFLNNSDPTNAGAFSVGIVGSTDARINSSIIGTGTYLPITFFTSGSERMRLDTSGNVGIGTASPEAKLDIVGTSATEQFRIGNTTGGTDFGITVTENATTVINSAEGATGRGIQFQSGGTNTVIFDSAGNLGIGTTTPANALEISRGAGVAGGASLRGNGNSAAAEFFVGQGSGSDAFLYNRANATMIFGTNNTTRMTLDASGNLGLGTTSLLSFANYTTLRVGGSSTTIGLISAYDGTTDMRMSTANNGTGIVGTSTNHPVVFVSNNTERARITSGGDVGIGTTTPGQKLEVAGNQRFTGSQVGTKIENRQTAVSVSTATTILDDAGALGKFVVVNGEASGNRFCDLVLCSTGVAPTVVSSFTALGTPAARTYTRSGSALQLAMASGTYSVYVLALGY